MNITIDKKLSTPVYAQIKNAIKNKIVSGELSSGFKLPAERALAKDIGVHRNTVIRAYEELITEDLISSSVSPRGYFVTYSQSDDYKKISKFSSRTYPGALNYMLKEEYLQMDTLFSQLFYEHQTPEKNDMISLAADIISPSLYPRKQLNTYLERIATDDSFDWFGVTPPQGLPALISQVQKHLQQRNIHASAKEIQIVSETYEAIQFLGKIFLSPYDTIIVEEPISPDMFQVFQSMNINVITIPVDEEGMETQYLEGLITKYRPKLIYTIPTFHFPSSTVMSLSRRYALLELSYKYDIPIIEEDCDSLIRYEDPPLPSLKSLDAMGNVIFIHSFICSICPGVRIAYMVAPEKIINNLSMIMENTQMFISPINQYVVSEFIRNGDLDDNIRKICTYGKRNRDCLCEALRQIKDVHFQFSVPKGGSCLWCKINESIHPKTLLYKAHELGVSYMPGTLFFPFRDKGDQYLRLSFCNSTEEELLEGVSRLAEAIRQTRHHTS